MTTLVKLLRHVAENVHGFEHVKIGGLLGDAASRIEDLEDHVYRLEDRLATAQNDIRALMGRPHRDG